MIFYLYTGVMVLLVLFIIFTIRYKGAFLKKWKNEKRDRLLYVFYGGSAYIVDFIGKHTSIIDLNKIKKERDMMNSSNIDLNKAYMILVRKVAISFICVISVIAFGYLQSWRAYNLDNNDIAFLKRGKYGEGDKTYNVQVYHKGDSKDISIVVPEREYTQEEALKLFTDSYDMGIKKMLGNNKDTLHIKDNLNLFESLDNGVNVKWTVESDVIDYTGMIQWNQVKDDINTNLTMTYFVGDYSVDYNVPITIIKKEDKDKTLSEIINDYVQNYSPTSNSVRLMKNINGEEISFRKKNSNYNLFYIPMALVMGVIAYLSLNQDEKKIMVSRRMQLQIDYPGIVNKFTILKGAGMTVSACVEKIIADYDEKYSNQPDKKRYAYEELKIAKEMIANGTPEGKGYLEYGRRCGIHSYIKFGNLLEQNITKGTKGLNQALIAEVNDAYQERRATVRKSIDEAGTKLLLPMGMLLIVSMALILVPALLSIKF